MFPQKNCELYVGQLEPNVDEQFLYNSFIKFGIIRSCKVMRHIVTHRSRGFGFITYQNPNSVFAAVKEMDNSLFFGKPIVVCSKEKYSKIDKSSSLLLLNLSDSFKDKHLEEMLKPFGKVFSKVFSNKKADPSEAPNTTVNTKKRVELHFEEISDALRFRKQYNGSNQEGNEIVVNYTNLNKNLVIKGLSEEGVKEKLESHLDKFGKNKILKFDNNNNSNNSYSSLVSFEDPNNARELLLTFKIDKKAFPVSSVTEYYDKNKKQTKKLQCSFYKKVSISEEDFKKFVDNSFQEIANITFESNKVTIEFTSEKSLTKFVTTAENSTSELFNKIDKNQGPIEYSKWLVNSLKSKRFNKFPSYFMPQKMYNTFGQPNMMQYNPQMMMQMMQYNPQMMMNMNYQQPNFQQQQQFYQQPHFGGHMMQNNNTKRNSRVSDISGLEVILNDTQSFKSKNKEEQNKIFMEIFVKKMKLINDSRYNDQKFMDQVASYFLDDEVVDLDERLDIVSENSKLQEFLTHLDDM